MSAPLHSLISGEAYMLHRKSLPLLLLLIPVLTACADSGAAARMQLAQMNIPFTENDFIDNARQGNSAAVTLFIDAGMSLEARDRVGQTPLMAATLADQIETVRLLLARKANPNAHDKYGGTALMTAAWKGNDEIVLSLLASGVDLNAKANNGMTALMFAAWENHIEISRVLLEKGADPDLRDREGWTALMRADFKGHKETVSILTEPQTHDAQ